VPDNLDALRYALAAALEAADVVLLSGGTSKGAGDISYRAVEELARPGIVAHGVALKPGKPICLAVHDGKPVVVLPGFPTSAIFTFHEFVAPVIRMLAGLVSQSPDVVQARLATKINSELGRTEYVLVSLVEGDASPSARPTADNRGPNAPSNADLPTGASPAAVRGSVSLEDAVSALPTGASPAPAPPTSGRELVAYPIGKGSGSVTTFSHADGVLTIGRHEAIVEAGSTVNVQLLGGRLRVADLVAIGSHCIGLDYLLGLLHREGYVTKQLNVGSTAGLEAAKRGECDIAGVHLLDPVTPQYNRPFLTEQLELVPGYGRMQGIVYRPGDKRFEGRSAGDAIQQALADPSCVMINRNTGSGTRLLIDRLLGGAQPPGYAVQPSSHTAVAAAVAQGRADWGVAIEAVARNARLGFLPLCEECYDFVVPRGRLHRPAVLAFRRLLADPEVRRALAEMGLRA
jgi:putative molybdopterin biosynthesis protein